MTYIYVYIEVTDINFRPIQEDNRSFPNGKFRIFNMCVNFIFNFMRNPKMNFILFFEVIRSMPMLKLIKKRK